MLVGETIKNVKCLRFQIWSNNQGVIGEQCIRDGHVNNVHKLDFSSRSCSSRNGA